MLHGRKRRYVKMKGKISKRKDTYSQPGVRKTGTVFITIFVLLFSGLTLNTFNSVSASETPPPSGDWTITDVDNAMIVSDTELPGGIHILEYASLYITDSIVTINGDLVIENGGCLQVSDSTLIFNCVEDGGYDLWGKTGSYVSLTSSIIRSGVPEDRYGFEKDGPGGFIISGSTIQDLYGYNDFTGGIQCISENIAITTSIVKSSISSGIYLYDCTGYIQDITVEN